MNIYALPGAKVLFSGKNGSDHDKKYNLEKGLVVGQVYTVKATDIGGWYTNVELEEVDGYFNSVCFDDPSEQT